MAMAGPGQILQCVAVLGGHGMRSRLAAMGLVPGVVVQVLSTRGPGGPLMIRIRDTRLGLGRGMARRIMVCPVRP